MAHKTDIRSSQKWSDNVSSSKASLHQNGFGLAFIHHNSTLNTLPWPQTGLVYITLKLVSQIQLPPRIWPPKMPNIPQKWRESAKNRLNTTKKPKHWVKTHFTNKLWAQAPDSMCAPFSRSYGEAMWPCAMHWPPFRAPAPGSVEL
jgi:hypothetical protein